VFFVQGSFVMAPKRGASTPAKKSSKSSSSSSSSSKKSASAKKQKMSPLSDKGEVRLDSPGFGVRADDKIQDHDALRRKYMLTQDYYQQIWLHYTSYKTANHPPEHKCPVLTEPTLIEDPDNQPVLSSHWWPTELIILPTAAHFPQTLGTEELDEETKSSSSAAMGLIRPVNVKQAEALLQSFKENGNCFDPNHPVRSRLRFKFPGHHTVCGIHCVCSYTQVWCVPFIEDVPEALQLYKENRTLFWGRLFDKDDPLRLQVKLLLADGGHRDYVSKKLGIKYMRVVMADPCISFSEIVLSPPFFLLAYYVHTPILHTLIMRVVLLRSFAESANHGWPCQAELPRQHVVLQSNLGTRL
jgi:hypothetical protein